MRGKIHLGKTATSRTRKKKVVEAVSCSLQLPTDDFTKYLLQKNYSTGTITGFLSDVKKFKVWLKKESIAIEQVSYNDITGYVQSLPPVSQRTKSYYLRGIKQYFQYLLKNQQRMDNPAEFVQIRGIKRKILYDLLTRQELDSLYQQYSIPDENDKYKNKNWFKSKVLAQKRNKVILGLMLYQALDTRDLKLLTVADVKLREGKISIPGTRKSDTRELTLEALQVMDLMEYLLTTRTALLQLTGKQTDHLFISVGSSERLANIMGYLLKRLKQLNKKVTSINQLKTSVIVHWLKLYNLRQVQYMAGHRYVSTTESYLVNEMDEMIEDIEKYHPIV